MTEKQRERAIKKALEKVLRLHTGLRRLPKDTEIEFVEGREQQVSGGAWYGKLGFSFYIPGEAIKP